MSVIAHTSYGVLEFENGESTLSHGIVDSIKRASASNKAKNDVKADRNAVKNALRDCTSKCETFIDNNDLRDRYGSGVYTVLLSVLNANREEVFSTNKGARLD